MNTLQCTQEQSTTPFKLVLQEFRLFFSAEPINGAPQARIIPEGILQARLVWQAPGESGCGKAAEFSLTLASAGSLTRICAHHLPLPFHHALPAILCTFLTPISPFQHCYQQRCPLLTALASTRHLCRTASRSPTSRPPT